MGRNILSVLSEGKCIDCGWDVDISVVEYRDPRTASGWNTFRYRSSCYCTPNAGVDVAVGRMEERAQEAYKESESERKRT